MLLEEINMKTYSLITKDDEVTSINQVEVKERTTEESNVDEVYTLPDVDVQIAKKQARIVHLQGDIAELQALRALVLDKAEDVKLKIDVAPKEMEVK